MSESSTMVCGGVSRACEVRSVCDPVSTGADTQRIEALAQGLVRLGYRRSEAFGRIEHAFARLAQGGSSTDDAEVLRLAIRSGRGA
ncbi:MAG: hypothetical protein AB7I09_20745 [Planctomycetota bacterium]